jgi:hypothetical protein
MDNELQSLVERLRTSFGDKLISVILYGSEAAGDRQPPYSDRNVLCVLSEVGPVQLAAAEPIFKWWRGRDNPAPLLLSAREVTTSTDCFPIEFHDMEECRRVLHGIDVIAGVKIQDHHYRGQLEYELRSKMLRLRQKAGGVMSDPGLLNQLMSDSVSTFIVLGKHALRLSGKPAPTAKREIVDAMEASLKIEAAPFRTLLEARSGTKLARGMEAERLFAQYLSSVEKLIETVDGIER